MAEQSFQDKTEQATPKKLDDARKKGEVAKSRELSSIAILTAGTIYLFFNAKTITMTLGNNLRKSFTMIPEVMAAGDLSPQMVSDIIVDFLILLAPLLLILMIVAILINLSQIGILFSVEALTPKASKIDPIKGFGRVFSKRSLVELAKSILKIAIVGWVAFSAFKNDLPRMIPLLYQENAQIFYLLGELSFDIMVKCCCVILVLAILDFMYQKWEYSQNLKMTKQEVKDEFKQSEGDPMVKSRIRSIQREMARRRMMEEVPKADVIITNPTHLSIALKYKPLEGMKAPLIVAKGANNIAFKIREIAAEHNIPLIENKPLAQNLYKLELGTEIPSHFYQAVAEILAYVYGLKKRGYKG
ncbi:MAG: flagellar biosynthesis protein FlhB [Desulfatiglans sp.]|mgnify:CR=1 FL=1|jgi:flagellar biosynthetic protein FlhB|nr:flagellar biosynthesis protein FlhB [Desulfatiglans sp.]